jgi:hypothetical protein
MRKGKGLDSGGNKGRRVGWGVGRERGEEELLLYLVSRHLGFSHCPVHIRINL